MSTTPVSNSAWRLLRPGNTLLLLAVAAVVALSFNGMRPLFDTSETRYAEAAREMAASGDWLVPRLGGQPHLTKPPLTYWLVGACIRIFGKDEFWVRLAPALFFIVLPLIVRDLGRTLFRRTAAGDAAAWLQLLALFPVGAASVVTTDTILATLETAAVWCMWRALRADTPRAARPWAVAAFVFLGFAFLDKGPPALVPLAAVIPFALACRKEVPWRRMWSPVGLLAFLALATAWPIAVAASLPQAWQVWKKEALVKVFQSSNRNMPRVYYPALLLGGGLPGTLALPLAIRDWMAQRRRGHATRPEVLFLALWLVVPLCIFMLSHTRLPLYIVPLFPPLSLLCGDALARRWAPDGGVLEVTRVPRAVIAAALVLLVLVPVAKAGYAIYGVRQQSHRVLKEEARAIAADAARLGVRPELIVLEVRMGNGLLFYLDGPPTRRFSAEDEVAITRLAYLKEQFAQPVKPGYQQYIVTQSREVSPFSSRILEPHVTWLHTDPNWTVLRRNSNDPVGIVAGSKDPNAGD